MLCSNRIYISIRDGAPFGLEWTHMASRLVRHRMGQGLITSPGRVCVFGSKILGIDRKCKLPLNCPLVEAGCG